VLGSTLTLPEKYSTDKPVNNLNEKSVGTQPLGTWTLSHGTGYGLLYVLTGEKHYADLARQCVDKIFAGQVDRDSRYNWTTPGTGFRMSYVLQSICLTYDLCADAWDEDYKKSVVEKVMNTNQKKVNKNKYYTLERLADADGYPPTSNHYGAYLLGPGLVALTFKGEPGADDARLEKIQATVEKNLKKVLTAGFGDYGWFSEGISCGRIAANNGVLPLMQSLKVAGGLDYITPRVNGRATVLRLMHEIVPTGKWVDEKAGKYYPMPSRPQIPHRGDYGNNELYQRPIISHMGDFAHGMGAVTDREAAAMAWIYANFIEPEGIEKWNMGPYPHLGLYAFVNWPETRIDPDEVLPHVIADTTHGYYAARNRWQDNKDALVTTLLKRGPHGYKSGRVGRGTSVWALQVKHGFGGLSGQTTHYRPGADGSMELADEKGQALVVDMSQTSGAYLLVARFGKDDYNDKRHDKAKVSNVQVAGKDVAVMTFSESGHPEVEVDGNAIRVGKQAIQVGEGKLTLETFKPAE
ncbi:MAG: hypothetical protein ACOCZE_06540, partial [Planctomycetota bacterium]